MLLIYSSASYIATYCGCVSVSVSVFVCVCLRLGPIPDSIGRLVNLRLLSLGEYTGGNGFTAAPLPDCIRHLRRLEALFMANCNLTGSIPSWIGGLTELRQLDMQRNMIVGECVCEYSLSNTTQKDYVLFYICLSVDLFIYTFIHSCTGTIPEAIGNCSNLLYLNLKDNEGLCGEIPTQPLIHLTRLNRLSLVHCNFTITTEALAELQTALPRCKVWV